MNGINTVSRKPLGRIKIIKNHKTPRGTMFRVGEIYDQYGVLAVGSGCSSCGNNKAKKSFRVIGGTIPYEKAVIIP